MYWANLLHIYQPPNWNKKIIRKVACESYRPIIKILKKHPQIKISLNICGSLTEQLPRAGLGDIIKDLIFLTKRGQIDFTGSAKYHIILPLLPTNEAERQINLNYKTNQKFFGNVYKPLGFFLPEMCYSKRAAKIIAELGYRWLILDEISYNGKLGKVSFNYGYFTKKPLLTVYFRNRQLSDPFFTASIKTVKDFYHLLRNDRRAKKFLLTAFDGENLGHHNPGMIKLWEKIILSPQVKKTITYSELLAYYKKFKPVEPIPSSWSSREDEIKRGIVFNLWKNPKNKIHRLQWQLTNLVLKTINNPEIKKDPNYKRARILLDKRINSDPFWWASANPWWSVEIIKEGAKNLIQILYLFKKINLSLKVRANELANQIIAEAKEWQESGRAEKIRKSYLAGELFERYFGGKIVK